MKLLIEVRWCVVCEAEEEFEWPDGDEAGEALCAGCSAAFFIGGAAQPAAMSRTPAMAVATPAA